MAKGHEISDQILERLRFYYLLDNIDNTEKKFDTYEISKKLNLKRDSKALDYPAEILNKILFDSKTKPWWIIVNSFSNYDYWKYTHSVNVALMALMAAIKLGYSMVELWDIGLGALLHDIGKLLVPKSIIQKTGTLTRQEMQYIMQHCELGVSITKEYGLPEEVTEIILHHHERNDGSGYPHGLTEDEIHRNVKIVIIADAIDAISSYRPYRPAKEISEAFKMLESERHKYSRDLVLLMEEVVRNVNLKV